MSIPSTTHTDFLTLLFSGLVLEVVLRVAPALRLALRNPLLCLARVAMGLGLVGLGGDMAWGLYSQTQEVVHAVFVRASSTLSSPSLLTDLTRLSSKTFAGLLLLASVFCLAGQGFTTLAWHFCPATKDSEILESEGESASLYRSPVTTRLRVWRSTD